MDNLKYGTRRFMRWGAVLAGALLTLGVQAQTGYYKWTDENGQVHYTQSPPPELKQGEVERLDLKTNTPSQGDETQTLSGAPNSAKPLPDCGSITFPKKMLSPVDRIAQLKANMALWQKYVDENSGSSDKKVQQRIQDMRCAIDYSKGELEALGEIEEKIKENYRQVTDELEELRQDVEACGDPQREESEPEVSVADCQGQYSRRIKELEKMKRSLEATNNTLKGAQ